MRFGIFRSHARRFSGFAKRSLRIGFAEEGIRQIDVRLRKIRLESHGGLKLANGRIDLLLREKYPSEGIVPFRTVRGHSHDVFECRLRRCQIPFLQGRNALGVDFIWLRRVTSLRSRTLRKQTAWQQKSNKHSGQHGPGDYAREMESSEGRTGVHDLLFTKIVARARQRVARAAS